MFEVKDPHYYNLLVNKYTPIHAALQGRKRVWLDTGFWMGLEEWIKDNYKCTKHEKDGQISLIFESEKDFIWFKLRV
jgi:hypothetical protein